MSKSQPHRSPAGMAASVKTPTLTIALAGNPNAGKTSLFNALTGLNQGVGNFPGKTVEKKTGICRRNGHTISVVDLPGTYSLTAFSLDERIARDHIISGEPDVVVCVADATNLERNLYLAVQIREIGVPLVLALNMADSARAQGIRIDTKWLGQLLGGIPVVATAANRGHGIDELLDAVVHSAENPTPPTFAIDYGTAIEAAIATIQTRLADEIFVDSFARWMALMLLESDQTVIETVREFDNGQAILAEVGAQIGRLETLFNDDLPIVSADHRYGFINGLVRQVQQKPVDRVALTDRIDDIVTHRYLGLPLFMLVMLLVFRLVIDVAAPFLNWVDAVITGPIASWTATILTAISAPAWLQSLVIEGIIAGVGGVLVFVPGLIVLYLFLAFLEDSGYLARAAFVMDRLMTVVGLHGKAMIPLILGFGCAVPAVYATRTMSNRRDRILTALLIPLMSCSARLPVYVVFGLAFFGRYAGTVIWIMYLVGIVIAVLAGLIFTRTILQPDENAAFVLELPPYRMPTGRSLLLHTWGNTKEFVHKAGTLILAVSVVLWLLLNLPLGVAEQEDSLFGQVSATVAPVFEPLGFGTWEATGSLITGFIAKELVVSTLSQIYIGAQDDLDIETTTSFAQDVLEIMVGFWEAAVDAARTLISIIPGIDLTGNNTEPEDVALSSALRDSFTPLSAVSFLVFVLLYVPCVATIAAVKQEFGKRWAVTAAVYQTALAWVCALLVYQGGLLLGYG
ncbi:MAG: ferrous iron transport protein B [Anaerolineae bacterium]|nr:ferrous iron transport protein B [Anaerolineae bacterium]